MFSKNALGLKGRGYVSSTIPTVIRTNVKRCNSGGKLEGKDEVVKHLKKEENNDRSKSWLASEKGQVLYERRRLRDHLLKTATNTIRLAIVNNTECARQAKKRHSLSDVMTKLLGRSMAAASLLASWQSGEERVILKFSGQGAVNFVYAEALRCGEVRSYTTTPNFVQTSNAPLGMAMKGGTLEVTKILYNQKTPFQSIVPLARADIASDIMSYYQFSEQIPAHCELESLTDYTGQVIFSGGILIEALPPIQSNESNVDYIKPYIERLKHLPPISILFSQEKHTLHEVLHQIAPGEINEALIEKQLLDFYCRCNKDKFKKSLLSLGTSQLNQLLNAQPSPEKLSFKCDYCSNQYHLDEQDIKELIQGHNT